MPGKTKGISFVHTRNFIRENFGAAGWDKLLATLTPEDHSSLESIVGVGWYELDLYARLLGAVERVHGRGDLSILRDNARYQAESDTKVVYRLSFRLANPAFVIEKSGEYWRRFHDTGTWTVKRDGKTRCTGTLAEWGVVDRLLCF